MVDNNASIRADVEARKKAEEEVLKTAEEKDKAITSSFVYECLRANERGDGMLFAAKHRGKYLFDKTSLQWYAWTGHYWTRDKLENVFELVEVVAMQYLAESEKINEQIAKAR